MTITKAKITVNKGNEAMTFVDFLTEDVCETKLIVHPFLCRCVWERKSIFGDYGGY